MKVKSKKTVIITILALIALSAAVYAVTRALKTARNTFTPSSVSVSVIENDTAAASEATVALAVTESGDYTADKRVEIQNTSPNSAQEVFVRVCLFSKFMNTEETDTQIYIPHESLPNTISGNTFTQGDVTFTLAENWQTDWTYEGGYFYYNNVVENGGKTTPLLTSVSFPKSIYDSYLTDGAALKVTVLADAIQSVGGAVENRWGVGGLTSNDVSRPSESSAEAAITAFREENLSLSSNDIALSDTALSASSVSAYVSDYAVKKVLSMVTTISSTVIYTLPDTSDTSDTSDLSDNAENTDTSDTSDISAIDETTDLDSNPEIADNNINADESYSYSDDNIDNSNSDSESED